MNNAIDNILLGSTKQHYAEFYKISPNAAINVQDRALPNRHLFSSALLDGDRSSRETQGPIAPLHPASAYWAAIHKLAKIAVH